MDTIYSRNDGKNISSGIIRISSEAKNYSQPREMIVKRYQ